MSRLELLLSLSLVLGGSTGSPAQAVATYTDTVAVTWAKRLLQAMHATESFVQAIDTVVARRRQADEFAASPDLFDSLSARARRSAPEFADSVAVIYARALTLPELMSLVQFYESPLGQRFAQARIAAELQTAEMARRWGMRLALGVMRGFVDRGLLPSGAPGARTPSSGTEMAYVTAMKSDLRNLVTAEEAYFADSVRYTDRFPALYYALATGNRLVTLELTRDGWWAQLSNANTVTTCVVFIGSTPAAPATREGEPQCR